MWLAFVDVGKPYISVDSNALTLRNINGALLRDGSSYHSMRMHACSKLIITKFWHRACFIIVVTSKNAANASCQCTTSIRRCILTLPNTLYKEILLRKRQFLSKLKSNSYCFLDWIIFLSDLFLDCCICMLSMHNSFHFRTCMLTMPVIPGFWSTLYSKLKPFETWLKLNHDTNHTYKHKSQVRMKIVDISKTRAADGRVMVVSARI